MAGLTDRYLDELGSLLAFDPTLAARMREEIAGHVEPAMSRTRWSIWTRRPRPTSDACSPASARRATWRGAS
jgi:hypothetical protein